MATDQKPKITVGRKYFRRTFYFFLMWCNLSPIEKNVLHGLIQIRLPFGGMCLYTTLCTVYQINYGEWKLFLLNLSGKWSPSLKLYLFLDYTVLLRFSHNSYTDLNDQSLLLINGDHTYHGCMVSHLLKLCNRSKTIIFVVFINWHCTGRKVPSSEHWGGDGSPTPWRSLRPLTWHTPGPESEQLNQKLHYLKWSQVQQWGTSYIVVDT